MLRETPYLVELQDLVAFLQCFLHATPRSLNGSFVVGMGTGGLVARIGTQLAEGNINLP
jgi:hypothetical protein